LNTLRARWDRATAVARDFAHQRKTGWHGALRRARWDRATAVARDFAHQRKTGWHGALRRARWDLNP